MAFESIQFKYTPPRTVSAVIPATSAAPPVSLATGNSQTNSGNAAASASAAGKLIARLADLLDTNQYLQQMILALSTGLGIELILRWIRKQQGRCKRSTRTCRCRRR